jgi:hypothetical protein
MKEIWKWYEIKLKYCQQVLNDDDLLISDNLKKLLIQIKKLEVDIQDPKSADKHELHKKKLLTLLRKFKEVFMSKKHYFYC